MAPQGKTSLCLEVFCTENDDTWCRSDGDIINDALNDLSRVGVLDRSRVDEDWLVRIPDAYQVYKIGYEEYLKDVKRCLEQWPTLHLLGRTGSFDYLNMDRVLEQARDRADTLAAEK